MPFVPDYLPCVEITPPGEVTSSVVWLHGLGASGHDFEPVVPHLHLPSTRFVFPHAPRRAVTINMGLIMPAWYDITGLTAATFGTSERHVRESARMVHDLLDRERERGVPSARTVLAGFSQGGAMALFAGVRYPEPLAGILVLSAHELLPATREAEQSGANSATPLLFAHGVYDPVVPVEAGRAAFRRYESEGRDVRWREFPIEHQVSMDEIEMVAAWLHERLETQP
jgi:phospholipase/carboxylesterase